MTATIRARFQFDLVTWEMEVTGSGVDCMSLTLTTSDGNALTIDDVQSIGLLYHASSAYLKEHARRAEAEENYAHDLNEWLSKALPGDGRPS